MPTDYNYTNATLNITSADSAVPPIVSPTGEMIQPGPSSYSKQTLSSMFNLKYHVFTMHACVMALIEVLKQNGVVYT